MFRTQLYSWKLANAHFWIGTLGILFYAIPMYWSGFTQGLMWKQFNAEGMLQYPNFVETVNAIIPMYAMRALGGSLYLTGVLMMTYNLIMTAVRGNFLADEPAQAYARGVLHANHSGDFWHRRLERRPVQMTFWATVAILIGSAVELIPTWLVKSNVPTIASVMPYTPLELQGRDLYIREGCVGCHSQMIRPFRSETERYGEYSKAGEYVYDHPFLWGSKRTGPDLLRLGGKYPDSWHYHHMLDPTTMTPGSIMPPYPWLFEQTLNTENTGDKIKAMRTLGVPYAEGYEATANDDLKKQADQIAQNLKEAGIEVKSDKEIVALIAYLQRLGTDIKKNSQ
jgi:cytochrome c oxidase cbb3-type subunit I/II